MTVVDDAFNSLFYGSGSWLGMLLFICLFLGITYAWKKAGVLTFPIAIFIGIEYLDNDLGWHSIIMFFLAIFIVLLVLKDSKGR